MRSRELPLEFQWGKFNALRTSLAYRNSATDYHHSLAGYRARLTLATRYFGRDFIFDSHKLLESCSDALWLSLAYRRSDSNHNYPLADNRARVNRASIAPDIIAVPQPICSTRQS